MSLYAKLQQRESQGKPITVGLIGAGKFGSMYLAQIRERPAFILPALRICRRTEREQTWRASAGKPRSPPQAPLIMPSKPAQLTSEMIGRLLFSIQPST